MNNTGPDTANRQSRGNPYQNIATERITVSDADVEERLDFIRKTYLHLAGAIAAFVFFTTFFFQTGVAAKILPYMVGGGSSWLLVLVLFMGVSWLADWWARNGSTPAMQYGGLGLYVFAFSVISIPLLYRAVAFASWHVLPAAAISTLSIFSLLTGYVFVSKRDFSFLGPFLAIASAAALGVIVVALLFGFNLGVIFAAAMVALAAGYIVYYTSNIMHVYRTDQHVAASLALFSSIGLLFWYILQLFMLSE